MFLTIWPGGERPDHSSLNPAPGQPPTPNAVTTKLSIDQEFEIYNNRGSVHLVIDVNGYYANHNHDDRYLTEADVRALLDAERPRGSGAVLAHGTAINNVPVNLTEETRAADGLTI